MVRIRSEWARFALGLALFGCGEPRSPVNPAPARAKPPEVASSPRPLALHLPPTELSALVHVHPSGLVRDAETRRFLETVFEPPRISEFSSLVGATPEEIDDLWLAWYPLGTLVLAEGRASSERVESRFLARALTHSTKVRPSGFRLSMGTTSEGPAAFVRLSGHAFAWAERDPSLARIVLAFAEGRAGRLPAASERKLLGRLLAFEPEQLAHLYLLGPFRGSSRPLAERTVGVALSFHVREHVLECGLELHGVFAPEASALVEAAWRDLVADLIEARLLRESPELLRPFTCDESEDEGTLDACSSTVSFRRTELENSLLLWKARTLGELARGPGTARNGSD